MKYAETSEETISVPRSGLAALLLAAIPRRAAAGAVGEPYFVGGVEDDAFGGNIWFNYLAGREARHITAGTYLVQIDDRSSTHNFRPPRPVGRRAARLPDGNELCGALLLERDLRGDARAELRLRVPSDADPGQLRGVIMAHPPAGNPPPPPDHRRKSARRDRRPRRPRRPSESSSAAGLPLSTGSHLHGAGPTDRDLLCGRPPDDTHSSRDVHDSSARLDLARLPFDRAGHRQEDSVGEIEHPIWT